MECYMLIGLPGSGKSTWMERNRNFLPRFKHLSTDKTIDRMAALQNKTYNEIFSNETMKIANRQLQDDLETAIDHEMAIVWDQTNMTRKSRAPKIATLKAANYKIYALIFNEPADLEARLASRPGKVIPYHVIASMRNSYQEPSFDEGFDEIRIISNS